ncbi:mucus-binding protein [Lactobacillus plantarum] [Lactiplantibacillus mudanjiangensis]|uniref:mucin-binding protein n=1 Tax=Lactiplantibacillus mudanjiangensis TaxID=1296538 RepID=UPI0010141297|nr:mucus-binding protein [Lactobacillus plantarum] [Lactiplantibacillus mudanjiangensis]
MRNRLNTMGIEGKTHYKLYKSGKRWITAGITVFSIGLGLTFSQVEQANAATGTSTDETENSANVSSSATTVAKKTVVLTSSSSDTEAKNTTDTMVATSTSSDSQSVATSESSSASSVATSATSNSTDTSSSSMASTTKEDANSSSTSATSQNAETASSSTAVTSSSSSVSSQANSSTSKVTNTSEVTSATSSVATAKSTTTVTSVASSVTPVISGVNNDTTMLNAVTGLKSNAVNMSIEALSASIEAAAATSKTTTDSDAKTTTTTITDSNGVTLTIIDSYGKSMTYKTNDLVTGAGKAGLQDLYALIESSISGIAEGDGLVTMYVQDSKGNYLIDNTGQRVNLLYLLMNTMENSDESLANSFTITYTNMNGTESTDVSALPWGELTNAGTYKMDITASGIQKLQGFMDKHDTEYNLPDGETVADFVPTFDSTADYGFQVQIIPATVGLVQAAGVNFNEITVSDDRQSYDGTISKVPTKISLFDGESKTKPLVIIENGVVSVVRATGFSGDPDVTVDGIGTKVGDVIFTKNDFKNVFSYTYTSNTDNLTGYDAGKYTISLTDAGLAKLQAYLGQNFIVSATSTSGKAPVFTINPATLTVSAADGTVTYNGTAQTTAVTVGTNYDNVTASDYTTTTGTNAGVYTITPSYTGTKAAILARNYVSTPTSGTLTINKEALTVTIKPVTVTYDKQTHGTTASVTTGTDYDNLIFTAVADDGVTNYTDAGTYSMTGTTTSAQANNYNISYVGAAITINQADATITISSKTFWNDGTEKDLTAVVDGTIGGETLNYSLTSGMSTVGTKSITATYDASDSINRNYAIKVTDGTLTIGDVAVKYTYEHVNADGTTQVDSTVMGTATHGSDATAADYLTYTTVASPKTGYTLLSDDTGLAPNGTLTGVGGTVQYIYLANTETATVTYVDQTTGKDIKTTSLQGAYGTTDAYTTADTITDYEKQGYEFVDSNFPTDGVVYDEDGTSKAYTVTLKHKTVTVTPDTPETPGQPIDPNNPDGPKYPDGTTTQDLTKQVSQTINYQYKGGSKAAADNIQTITFDRNAIVDAVNGTLTYTEWLNNTSATGSYTAVKSPVITGYTADNLSVTGNDSVANTDNNTTVTVTYNANPETATVMYFDATTGTQLGDLVTLTGEYNSQSTYRTADDIANYVKNGYELENDDYPTSGIVFDEDGVVKSYTVTLKHKTVTMTPDTPGTPGQPIDPANPDGPKYPDGTTMQDLTKQVSQTINYQYKDGSKAAEDNSQTVTFTRNVTIDEVDGALTYTDWLNGTATVGSYTTVKSPTVAGYTPDKASVVKNDVVSFSDKNSIVTVTYSINQEAATVTYFDTTTGKQIGDPVKLTGDYNAQSTYRTADTIANYVKSGYVLVNDGYPTDGVLFDQDGIVKNYTVTLKHKTVTATPDNPGTPGQPIDPVNPDGPKYPDGTTMQDLTKQVSQKINYQYKDGTVAADDNVQTVTFKRNVTVDEVNGALTYTEWLNDTSATGNYTAVETPAKTGYKADKLSVAGNDAVSASDKDTTVVVTYSPNDELVNVNYVDLNAGNVVVANDQINGKYQTSATYSTANQLTIFAKQGYVLVSDGVPATIVFDTDGPQTYTVQLKHRQQTVTTTDVVTPGTPVNPTDPDSPVYPNVTLNLTATVKRVINYVYADGGAAQPSVTQTASATRTATIDLVTGDVSYGDWNKDKVTLPAQQTPALSGYTADLAEVAHVDVVATDGDLAPVTVTYTKDQVSVSDGNITVTYIDGTTGTKLTEKTLTGTVGTVASYQTVNTIAAYQQLGYILVRDGYPTNAAFTTTGQAYTVYLTHDKRVVTANDDTKLDLMKIVTQTIHYVYNNGQTAVPDKVTTRTFTRQAIVDLVTGATTYGPWQLTTGDSEFAAVTSPSISGYTADQTSSKVVAITAESADDVQKVTYTGVVTPQVPSEPSDSQVPSQPDQPGTTGEQTAIVTPGLQPMPVSQAAKILPVKSVNVTRPDQAPQSQQKTVATAKINASRPKLKVSIANGHKPASKATLPQTSEQSNHVLASVLGLSLATLLGSLGLYKKQREEK